jgi:hypothetical protein
LSPVEAYSLSVATDLGKHGLFLPAVLTIWMLVLLGLSWALVDTDTPESLRTFLTLVGISVPLLVIFGGRRALRKHFGIPTDQVRGAPALRQSEQKIRERLMQIETRQRQIEKVLSRVRQSSEPQWAAVREKLESALLTLIRQQARYALKLQEIEIVRLQNRLAPFLSDLESLNYEENEYRLTMLENVFITGQAIRSKLNQLTPSSPPVEARGLLQRVDETLASCKKLRDALVGRQATLTLKGVTPLTDSLQPIPAPDTALRKLEAFNIQVAISDLSSSFDELEAEYLRIQGEQELLSQVSEIIEMAERSR